MIQRTCGDRVLPAGVANGGFPEVMLLGGVNDQEEPAKQKFGKRAP